MKLLTRSEAEKLVRAASNIAQVPATAKELQEALRSNGNDAIVLLLKR